MFPLKDNIPSKRFPVVNTWLIIVNVLCYLYTAQYGYAAQQILLEYGFVPARFMFQQSRNIFDLSRFIPVFTSMFLHGGLFHVAANMWMLWIFGDNIEDRMGHGRYLLFYLLCGCAAVFSQAIFSLGSHVPMIGASGAIAGVLGAYIMLFPGAQILTFIPIFFFFYLVNLPAFIFLGLWFLFQFLQGATVFVQQAAGDIRGGVAWWAHIGGFLCGVGWVLLFGNQLKTRKYIKKRTL